MAASSPGRRGCVKRLATDSYTGNQKSQKILVNQQGMAERVGFEPTVQMPVTAIWPSEPNFLWKNTDLWEASYPSGPGLTLQGFDPPLPYMKA